MANIPPTAAAVPNLSSLPVASYIGPLSASNRIDLAGNLFCQLPCCNEVVFIYDPELNANLCDLHKEIAQSQYYAKYQLQVCCKKYQAFLYKNSTATEIVTKTA